MCQQLPSANHVIGTPNNNVRVMQTGSDEVVKQTPPHRFTGETVGRFFGVQNHTTISIYDCTL